MSKIKTEINLYLSKKKKKLFYTDRYVQYLNFTEIPEIQTSRYILSFCLFFFLFFLLFDKALVKEKSQICTNKEKRAFFPYILRFPYHKLATAIGTVYIIAIMRLFFNPLRNGFF
jgi:hypothetical protein